MPGMLIVLLGMSLNFEKQFAYNPLPPGPWLPPITGPATVLSLALIKRTAPVLGSIQTKLPLMIPITATYMLASVYEVLLDNVKGTVDWLWALLFVSRKKVSTNASQRLF